MELDAKEELRRRLMALRDATSSDMVRIASTQVQGRLAEIPEFRDASDIACYYPVGNELDTTRIMEDAQSRGARVYLPRVHDNTMRFYRVRADDDLEPGAFGLREPRADCTLAARLDVVLVPMVGASRDGTRLGYGRGYYDRFLAANDITTIALGYAKQIAKSVPRTERDIPMDYIVTEEETIRTVS